MPAIQVSRTDTFEQQRQKINSLGSTLFSISAGGSDLSTGNLKLGDGLVGIPSLAFVTDASLGIFKASSETMGFVSSSKKIFEYNSSGSYFFRDLLIQKKEIDVVSIQNEGQNYDAGSYNNIPATQGAGSAATLNIVVSAYSGITASGSGYTAPASAGGGPGGGSQQYSSIPLTGGNGTGSVATLLFSNGGFSSTNITTHGTGYTTGNVLTLPPSKNNISITITENSGNITVTSTVGFFVGMILTKVSGAQSLTAQTDMGGASLPITITGITDATTIQTSAQGSADGSAVYNFAAPWGSGTGYSYTINKLGIISSVAVNAVGNGYDVGNVLSVNNLNLIQPINYTVATKQNTTITFTGTVPSSAFIVGNNYTFTATGPTGDTTTTVTVVERQLISTNISSIIVTIVGTQGSVAAGNTSGGYTVDTVTTGNFYTIDFGLGAGAQLYPSFTLLKNNKYVLTHPSDHPLKFSIHPRGKWNTKNVGALTLSTSSKVLSIANTSGILPGMILSRDSSVTGEFGSFANNTTVVSVTSNTVTISEFPSSAGTATTIFTGAQYSGTEVIYGNTTVTFSPSVDTPATLYYYCNQHNGESGGIGYEAVVTVSQINPKIFGSDLEILIDEVVITDMLVADIETGSLTVSDIIGESISGTDLTITTATIPTLSSSISVTTPLLQNTTNLTLKSGAANSVVFDTLSVTMGNFLTVTTSTGKLETTGEIKTTNKINVSDVLNITNSTIQSLGSNDIILTPAVNRVAKIDSASALIIPSGATSSRPTILSEDGAIRFNTSTQQYEGYSETNSTWSSLGGVRDLDGNTYILAEATVGANDNTLYLVNDDINTVKFSPTYQEFVNVKKIRSINVSAPSYTTWNSNIPVTVGQYLKYGNNIYIVVTAGVTGTSGSEPTNTTGSNFPNGTSVLAWSVTAVAPLTFEEISELRIAPTGGTPLSINGDLRLSTNVISTDVNDLIIRPNSGKKVTIDAQSSLVIPVGNTNARGAALRGSIRYNTTISQYEGYDGINWSSLGGVRDVDGNTYIIPELGAGTNENILYFYNNGSNTLQLNSNKLEFRSIDTIESVTSGSLNLNANLITFNSLSASIDTSSATRTLISTTKDNLDFGLSSGLNNDPLVRLTDTGELFYNIAFGTGTFSGIKVFNSTLRDFELSDYKLSTTRVTLTRGTTNSDSVVLYSPALHSASKVQIVAKNVTTGDSEFIEYSVIDKGNDIFYTEFGNIKTGVELFSCAFDFNESNSVRVTFTINSALLSGTAIQFTVINNIIKR